MSKISICYGSLKCDFEGTEEFIKAELIGLLTGISGLTSPTPASTDQKLAIGGEPPKSAVNLSTKAIYSKLGIDSGRGLVIAAAAFLTFAQQRETFSRDDLHEAMKSATGIYDKSKHGSNLSSIISNLIKADSFQETASGQYSLAQAERDKIGNVLNGSAH